MANLDKILQELVVPKHDNSTPDINGILAGYTTSASTQYVGAAGVKNIETMEPVDLDTVVSFFSCTKTMTAMAMLKLWEEGKVDLDAPAKTYLPILGEFGIIEEDQLDPDTGKLKYPAKKPEIDVTIRHLLLNNSGFAYMFTDSDYLVLHMKHKTHGGNPTTKLFTPEVMPLLFEPGTQWKYGHSMDWVGLIVQAVSGMKLSEFLKKNIFEQAGMDHCTFRIDDPSKMMKLHQRSKDQLKLLRMKPLPLKPTVDMGGQGCFGTVGDYLKFLRIWLNYGTSPDTGKRILRRETVEYAIQNHLPDGQFVEFATAMNINEGEFDPDGFTLAGCAYNNNDLPTGRPSGSIYWGGLANLYFWIDFKNDCAGFFGCQMMPYMDLKCVLGYIRFEYEAYQDLKRRRSKI
ncbi:CIC11C00000002817 [Sungouiella intermedia]|uniref:CIC11C00000002817 n=1 Tax=Sungouiella intermedia TaxID=45354 RepID=A0A1L0C256_9ASCO|nr:CIC11C00000002817 [[Candida] intermedia]